MSFKLVSFFNRNLVSNGFKSKYFQNNFVRFQSKHVVFSGIQPSGIPHLGNYFGAMTLWKKLQDDSNKDCIFSVVNLHSLTSTPIIPKDLENFTYVILSCMIASGIDPSKSLIFKQSDIKEHTLLCWILSCHFSLSQLQRLPSFKEKTENLEFIPVGLLLYPCLQAADIILYNTNLVPIGRDNLANIHIAQDIIDKLNKLYKCDIPKPEPLIDEKIFSIKSLKSPDKKMSKSENSELSKIMLLDESDEIFLKIKKAKTDFMSQVTYDPKNRPGVSNLVLLKHLISKDSIDKIIEDSANIDTGKFKLILADQLIEYFKPIKTKANQLLNERAYLDKIFEDGSLKAKAIASKNLEKILAVTGMNKNIKT